MQKIIYKKYRIYSNGNIFRLKKNTRQGRILRPCKDKNGYLMVNLRINGESKTKSIHRLIAETFIPNIKNKPAINHKNGIKTDNRIQNLEWVTYSENMLHAYRVLNRVRSKHRSIPVIQKKDGLIIGEFSSMAEASRELKIPIHGIWNCIDKPNKTYKGFTWECQNLINQ